MSREYDAMMRLETEDIIPLKRARPLFIGSPTLRTLQRYICQGYRCPDHGVLIYLEAFRGTGRSWWTSRQAVQRFWARVNGKDV